jgi:hypothetical protein
LSNKEQQKEHNKKNAHLDSRIPNSKLSPGVLSTIVTTGVSSEQKEKKSQKKLQKKNSTVPVSKVDPTKEERRKKKEERKSRSKNIQNGKHITFSTTNDDWTTSTSVWNF